MKRPLFIRPLTEDERRQIQAGLRSKEAFVLRRAQILLASDRGERATAIANQFGCHRQTVLNIIHGFNATGLAVFEEGSSRPHRLRTSFPDAALEALRDLLHRSPRDFGLETSMWTLSLAAQISFLDEVWWSRFALPALNAWQSTDDPVHLVEQLWQKHDPDPKAFACYGVLWQQGPVTDPVRRQMTLRFVDGRPISAITTQFLEWICSRLQAAGKTAWLLIWDNASWHYSKHVRTWIREHNTQVKHESKGVRILPFFLPTKSPWLNPIEPKWVHAKKAVVEPNGLLTAKQLVERICTHFGCSCVAPLPIVEEAA